MPRSKVAKKVEANAKRKGASPAAAKKAAQKFTARMKGKK